MFRIYSCIHYLALGWLGGVGRLGARDRFMVRECNIHIISHEQQVIYCVNGSSPTREWMVRDRQVRVQAGYSPHKGSVGLTLE